ncbi:MAG: HAMP domain-containing sensor histidine kinase [Spirochaetia bacterium]|nr:HAMP domain-containing sensor histidine kinase [Spirochaetia bacterium]
MSNFFRIRKNKIIFKLLGLFTVLIIAVALIMLLSVNLLTSRQFKRFILESDLIIAKDYAILLKQYYEQNENTWEEVDTFVHSLWQDSIERMDMVMSTNMSHQDMMDSVIVPLLENSQRLILINNTGQIISDSLEIKVGEIHPPKHWLKGVPIKLADKIVGTVLYGTMIEPVLNPLDQDFLKSVNWAIALSTLIIVLIAIILGYYFVSSIVSPLNYLSKAISKITDGELDVQVSINSGDEINNLANNFNNMSRKLTEAKKWRSQLTADIAHEIRTPITTIQGELEAILDGVYPMDISIIKNIFQDTVVLSSIVEDLQFLESFEDSSMLLNLKNEDICEILNNISNSFKKIAFGKKITLVKNYGENIPLIQLDERRIRQVLNNLLSNSLRYSPRGSKIILTAHIINSGITDKLIFSVKDSGVGIKKEHLSKIFDRFYRVDSSRSRSSGGSGLGLSISKSIIEAHGGKIEAESIVGAGTTISCIFELNPSV